MLISQNRTRNFGFPIRSTPSEVLNTILAGKVTTGHYETVGGPLKKTAREKWKT